MVTEALEAAQHATFQRRAEGAGQLTLLQLGHIRMQGAPWGCKRGVPGAESHQGAPPHRLLANHPLSPGVWSPWALVSTLHFRITWRGVLLVFDFLKI